MATLLVALMLVGMLLFVAMPNIVLALVTLNRADEDTHMAFGAAAFIPWMLFGLHLAA